MAGDAKERLTAQERRAQILRCATVVFARSNYRVAGMAEIAKEAGISEPTVYKHFDSKRHLFLTILDKVGTYTLRHWEELAERAPDTFSLLRQIGLSHFDIVQAHPDNLKVQFQALSETEDEEIRSTLKRNFAAYADFIARVLSEGKARGEVHPQLDVRSSAWQMISIGFTLNLTSLLGFSSELSRETLEVMGDTLLLTFGTDAPAREDLSGAAKRRAKPPVKTPHEKPIMKNPLAKGSKA
jgi:AcrR family transcriptional regulator